VEAKDTILVEPQMAQALLDYGLFVVNQYPQEIYELLQKQAEVSFKEGIEEGVRRAMRNNARLPL